MSSKHLVDKYDPFSVTCRTSATGREKGKCDFKESDGKGTIEVKYNGDEPLGACVVVVKVGDEPEEIINHNFSPDGGDNICKLSKEFDFRKVSNQKEKMVLWEVFRLSPAEG